MKNNVFIEIHESGVTTVKAIVHWKSSTSDHEYTEYATWLSELEKSANSGGLTCVSTNLKTVIYGIDATILQSTAGLNISLAEAKEAFQEFIKNSSMCCIM